ncbi:MAG: LptA/OstA family protein [Steroidobacteraceae bacterium]
MCWRIEARAHAFAALLQILALGTASAAALAATLDEAPVAGAASAASADREACNEPLCYTASRLEAERNRMVLHDINIVDTTRGITRINADLAEANGPDPGNCDWVLTGHVQVVTPQGKLSADKATVQFVNKRIASMSAQGAPAEFEHSIDSAAQSLVQRDAGNRSHGEVGTARGHAREIDYDVERDLVTLKGDSWLSDGCNEINSQSIVYDIANQKVRAEAAPGDDAQVHGTLHARSGTQCGSAAGRP